jgi:hypothetical protein
MGHNDYNFQYIKDKTKALAGKYFQRFELRDGDCFGDDNWSDCENKRKDVWIDGVQKVKILKSPINFVPEEIYFKHGIYRSFTSKYKERKKKNKMPTQVVFYDEIRRGGSIEEVDININPKLKPVD